MHGSDGLQAFVAGARVAVGGRKARRNGLQLLGEGGGESVCLPICNFVSTRKRIRAIFATYLDAVVFRLVPVLSKKSRFAKGQIVCRTICVLA